MYVDPGSGTLLLQVLLAGLVGGLVTARRVIARAARWLAGRLSKPRGTAHAPPKRDDVDG